MPFRSKLDLDDYLLRAFFDLECFGCLTVQGKGWSRINLITMNPRRKSKKNSHSPTCLNQSWSLKSTGFSLWLKFIASAKSRESLQFSKGQRGSKWAYKPPVGIISLALVVHKNSITNVATDSKVTIMYSTKYNT